MPDSHGFREICACCHLPSPVGFSVPDEVWAACVPERLRGGVLCIRCFAMYGDEAGVFWERAIEFWPVSLRTHLEERKETERRSADHRTVVAFFKLVLSERRAIIKRHRLAEPGDSSLTDFEAGNAALLRAKERGILAQVLADVQRASGGRAHV